MTDKREIRKVNTDEIEGEYILKNTDPGKKRIIFSTVIWYDPETEKYYFKSESDMNGNALAGKVVSHKLIQDLLSISKWTLKPLGKLWNDPSRVLSGGIDTEKMDVDWKLGYKPKKQNGKPFKRNKRSWGDKPSTTQFRRTDSSINHDGPKYAGAPYNREEDEEAIKSALDRLRENEEFICQKCGVLIRTIGDGTVDPKSWKIFHDCGLCYGCWKIQKDPDASTEKFQRSMDEFWDEVKDDLDGTKEDLR